MMFSGNLVKDAIEHLGPEYLGASVGVDTVDLSLTEGAASIRGLLVGNPEGFEGSHAMRLGEAKVVLDPSGIIDTLVIIEQILVDGADVAAIARGRQTNFEKLLENITENSGGATTSETEAASGTEAEIQFIANRFDFTNVKASLASDLLGVMEINIADIHPTDIGRKTSGATAVELAKQILRPISRYISEEAVKQGIDLEGAKREAIEKVDGKIDEIIEEELGSDFKILTDRLRKRD